MNAQGGNINSKKAHNHTAKFIALLRETKPS
jgi:hypothetical protein